MFFLLVATFALGSAVGQLYHVLVFPTSSLSSQARGGRDAPVGRKVRQVAR